jgi:hypothetical protein
MRCLSMSICVGRRSRGRIQDRRQGWSRACRMVICFSWSRSRRRRPTNEEVWVPDISHLSIPDTLQVSSLQGSRCCPGFGFQTRSRLLEPSRFAALISGISGAPQRLGGTHHHVQPLLHGVSVPCAGCIAGNAEDTPVRHDVEFSPFGQLHEHLVREVA